MNQEIINYDILQLRNTRLKNTVLYVEGSYRMSVQCCPNCVATPEELPLPLKRLLQQYLLSHQLLL